jgi:Rrf2 family protein
MFMKLTRSVGYAVGILLRVQGAVAEGPMTADSISQGCKFPPRFLYRVLRRLVDAGLLRGISGPRGGYTLAKSTRQVRLLEIVQAVEEGVNSGGLVPVNRQQKPAIEFVNELCERSALQMQKQLAKVTLAELALLCKPARRAPTKGSRRKKSAASEAKGRKARSPK